MSYYDGQRQAITRNLEAAQVQAGERRRTAHKGTTPLPDAPTVCYRLYTEYWPGLTPLVVAYVPAATVQPAMTGIWHGQQEHAAIIEILGQPNAYPAVLALARAIKEANQQEAVLVSQTPIVARFV